MQRTLPMPLIILMLLAVSEARSADPLVADVLEERGYEPISPSQIEKYLLTGLYVQSERLSRSNVKTYKKTNMLGDGANIKYPEYLQVVEVPEETGGILMAVELSPDEIERIKTEQLGDAYPSALEAYAGGLLAVGTVVDAQFTSRLFGTEPRMAALGIDHDQGPAHMHPDALQNYYVFCPAALGMTELNNDLIDTDVSLEDYIANARVGRISDRLIGPFSATTFFFGPACLLEATAAMLRAPPERAPEAVADARYRRQQELMESIVFLGINILNDVEVAKFSVFDLDVKQTAKDGTVSTINAATFHVDTEHMTKRMIRLEGTITRNGESRDFFLENEYDDFRYVDNTVLYEPYKQTQRMGGILGPEERAQMQEAKQKLDEFERQMAAMPASQRRMMENMMGSQMDQFRQLANDGTVEIVVITQEIEINPDLGIGRGGGIIPPAQPEPTQTNLVQIIQGHLVTLGYKPGATNGELTRQTVVAITQYEAASGMPVTGKATPQLAGRLAAAVDAL